MKQKTSNYRRKAYKAWHNMKARCLDGTHKKFPRYGGRGISIYSEWVESFEAFYVYVGDPPSPRYSLDRIDNDGNYEPGNVRWATSITQRLNSSVPIKPVRFAGVTYGSMAAAAKAFGLNKDTLHRRLSRGWTLEDALTKPKQRRPG